MFLLEIDDHFSSAHQLRNYRGKCENLHGHNWLVKITVRGMELLPTGILIDFGELKKLLAAELSSLDHCNLNELPPFDKINPTSELIAQEIYQRLSPKLPENVELSAVTVWESEKCRAIYQP